MCNYGAPVRAQKAKCEKVNNGADWSKLTASTTATLAAAIKPIGRLIRAPINYRGTTEFEAAKNQARRMIDERAATVRRAYLAVEPQRRWSTWAQDLAALDKYRTVLDQPISAAERAKRLIQGDEGTYALRRQFWNEANAAAGLIVFAAAQGRRAFLPLAARERSTAGQMVAQAQRSSKYGGAGPIFTDPRGALASLPPWLKTAAFLFIAVSIFGVLKK